VLVGDNFDVFAESPSVLLESCFSIAYTHKVLVAYDINDRFRRTSNTAVFLLGISVLSAIEMLHENDY